MAREVINRKGGAGEGAGSASEVITAEESSNLQNPPPPWDALRDPDLKLPPRPPQRSLQPRTAQTALSTAAVSERSAVCKPRSQRRNSGQTASLQKSNAGKPRGVPTPRVSPPEVLVYKKSSLNTAGFRSSLLNIIYLAETASRVYKDAFRKQS